MAVDEIPSLTEQGKIWQMQELYDVLSDYSIITLQILRFSDFVFCGLVRRLFFQDRRQAILTFEHDQKGKRYQNARKYVQKHFFDEKIQDILYQAELPMKPHKQ